MEEPSAIALNFPEDVELKTLVDYVSQRLGLNIIYQDEQLANQKVTIKSPAKVPATALLGLLQNLLKIKGFALVDAEQAGFKRIVSMQSSAMPATQRTTLGEQVVTQAFPLQVVDATRAETAIKPFLSGATAGVIGIPEQHLLLVTDFASNLARLGQILELIDQPNRNLKVEFIPVKNADATQLSQQIKQILLAKSRATSAPGSNVENGVEVTQDRRTGQLVVVGPAAQIEEARNVVAALDVPVTEQQSPIHFYKLANATAADVLETIRALEGEAAAEQKPAAANAPSQNTSAISPQGTGTLPGATPAPASKPAARHRPAAFQPAARAVFRNPAWALPPPARAASASPAASEPPPPLPRRRLPASALRNANVAADPNTNTIIVVAEPTVQKQYEQIIRSLDKRRPQVLIEATIVSLDTSHGFTFGVEISGNSQPGKNRRS